MVWTAAVEALKIHLVSSPLRMAGKRWRSQKARR
jgi:hypothetical protein